MSAGGIYRSEVVTARPFSRFLDLNGDGTGGKDAAQNFSAASTPFFIQPAPGQRFLITRMIVNIVDGGAIDAGSYGNGIVLTNGITVNGQTLGAGLQLTDPGALGPILTNAGWAKYSYDVSNLSFGGGANYAIVRWDFADSGEGFGPIGSPIQLDGNLGDFLAVNLFDNFSGLIEHTFTVQGVEFF